MAECVVSYKPTKEKNNLFLASFSNGRLTSVGADELEFKAYSCSQTQDGIKKRKENILVAETSRLSYCGSNFDDSATDPNLSTNFFVCVLNKRKRKMKVYSTDLHYCKPILDIARSESELDTTASYAEKVRYLTSSFGSKAKQRSLTSRLRYQVESGVMETAMSSAVNEFVNDTDDGSQNDSLSSELDDVLPPRNDVATSVEDVYRLHDIIPEKEFSDLEPQASEILNAESADLEEWSKDGTVAKFVLEHIKSNKGHLSLHKAKMLAYYNYMVQFNKLGYSEVNRKDPAPKIPEPFKSSLLARFVVNVHSESGGVKRKVPQRMRDKMIAHMLVLALFIEDYLVDLTVFQSDLKCRADKLIKVSHALGCHVVYQKPAKRMANLTIPLFVAKESLGGNRKRN